MLNVYIMLSTYRRLRDPCGAEAQRFGASILSPGYILNYQVFGELLDVILYIYVICDMYVIYIYIFNILWLYNIEKYSNYNK